MRRVWGRLIVCALAATAAAMAPGAAAQGAASGSFPTLPATINGLSVTAEDIGKARAAASGTQYLADVRLVSLRDPDKQLEATLELGLFGANADVGSSDFQRSVAEQIGDGVAVTVQVGGRPVFVKTSRKLSILVWFTGTTLSVLSVRDTYPSPKALLRATLAITG